MDFGAVVAVLMGTVLVNNYVLNRFLGICPFLGVTKELKNSIGMGLSITFVMVFASAITWPINNFILRQHELDYLQTIVFVLVIAAFVQLVEITLKKYVPSLYKAFGVFLPLMATNCSILAVTLENVRGDLTLGLSLLTAFGSGFGVMLAMVVFSGIREHIESANPPQAFRGVPIKLISVAILSLSFFGFSSVIENLFH
ncbi:MAG: RnfABCDGE type electron transport complex subunit A [Treponema sp.]|nr:RnfABCDGE type electron transport complex subunit A [Treponema sp.]